jgi:Icc-related predicted phosphoesterase
MGEERELRIVCISDIHNRLFRPPTIPPGDVLVVAGDLCLNGDLKELEEVAEFLGTQPFSYIISIAGNHDFAFQEHPATAREVLRRRNIKYLEDQELVIGGIKFYGSPWTPTFFEWAFMKARGTEIRAMWDKIPHDTNVLITHGPPQGILDKTIIWGDMAGCEELRDVVVNHLPDLKLHVFGHIHEGYGTYSPHMIGRGGDNPIFVNASLCNEAYSPINPPIVVEI